MIGASKLPNLYASKYTNKSLKFNENMRECNFIDTYPADYLFEKYHVCPSVHIQQLKNSWQILMLGDLQGTVEPVHF